MARRPFRGAEAVGYAMGYGRMDRTEAGRGAAARCPTDRCASSLAARACAHRARLSSVGAGAKMRSAPARAVAMAILRRCWESSVLGRGREFAAARARVALSASSAVRRDRSVVPSADESLYSCAIASGACTMMYRKWCCSWCLLLVLGLQRRPWSCRRARRRRRRLLHPSPRTRACSLGSPPRSD